MMYTFVCQKCKKVWNGRCSVAEKDTIKCECGGETKTRFGIPLIFMDGKPLIHELSPGERGDLNDDFSQACYDGSKHGESWNDFKEKECKNGTLAGYSRSGKKLS